MIEKVDEKGGIWSYNYHPSGLMGSVTRPDGKDVTFAYDAVGRRISKRFDGRTNKFLWDANKIMHEWVEDSEQTSLNDQQIVTWLFEEETFAPIAKLTKEKAYNIINDHLGTPSIMLDPDGKIVWGKTFDLFGRELQDDSTTACPFRFQGQYEDEETGLYYNQFRYYDACTSQSMEQDPFGESDFVWVCA